jgi:hypothetical protein
MQAELALKKRDLEAPRPKSGLGRFLSQPNAGLIIGGVIGIISALVANFLQSRSAIELERQKLESTLITKAVETLDPAVSSRNLRFLLKAGLIRDPDGRIARASSPADAPVFATPSGEPVRLTPEQRTSFFDNYQQAFGTVDTETRQRLTSIFDLLERNPEISDIRTLAYTLATIKHETNDTFRPLTEVGSPALLEQRYGPQSPIGRSLGNVQEGDGARYRGRGFLQITGRRNYAAMSLALGLRGTPGDLVNNPDNMLRPEVAFRAAIISLTQGALTGRRLSDFITPERADYRNARKVVNGLDRADLIAQHAERFEAILRQSIEQ